jgi:hypothetical protein
MAVLCNLDGLMMVISGIDSTMSRYPYPMTFRHKGPRKTKNAPAAIKAKPIA